MFCQWCTERELQLSSVGRAHIEFYARWLQEQGRARATIAQRLSTIVSFYRYAEEEHLIAQSPRSTCVARSSTTSPERSVSTAMRSAHCWSPPRLCAVVLARVADLRGVGANRRPGRRTDIEPRCSARAHPARPSDAIDLAVGERADGPIFLSVHGQRLDRRRPARCGGFATCRIAKRIGPHSLRHAFITAALDAGVPPRDVEEAASHADPRTTMRYDRQRSRSTGTRPTSSPPSSPAPPVDRHSRWGGPRHMRSLPGRDRSARDQATGRAQNCEDSPIARPRGASRRFAVAGLWDLGPYRCGRTRLLTRSVTTRR